jgi:DNA processing protein
METINVWDWLLWKHKKWEGTADAEERARELGLCPDEFEEELEKLPSDARIVSSDGPEYPDSLRDLTNPPRYIYVRGQSPPVNALAFIGTRRATRWDEELIRGFVGELVARGHHVLSGGAFGVDIWSHQAALQAGSPTTIVVPGGLDHMSPKRHLPEFEAALEGGGGILSLQPLGTQPFKSLYAPRNALLAALSSGVVVLRSGETGGTMITVEIAKRIGRPVYALPGDPRDDTCRGCLKLVKTGAAQLIWEPAHLSAHEPSSTKGSLIDLLRTTESLHTAFEQSTLEWHQFEEQVFELEIRGQIKRLGDVVKVTT